MDNEERFELNDEELDKVVGGIDVGDRVKVNDFIEVKADCCGHVERCADFACSVQ